MTLLIMLAVIKGYVIIPWWAWSAGCLHALWNLVILASATKAEYRKNQLSKLNESFIHDLMGKMQEIAPSQIPMGPLYGSSDSPLN